MTFAIGIFDIFAYTIPGSLYLALLGYLTVRLDWIEPGAVGSLPVLLLVIAAVLLSYLLGFLAYPLGAFANRMLPRRRTRQAREAFLARVPAARDRAYVRADPHLLLSAAQWHDKDVAVDVTRLRATGLMLRNSAPPLALGCVAAIVELIAGTRPGFMVSAAVVLGIGFVALIVQGRRIGTWATSKTLELCFWIPDIDEKFRTSGPLTGAGEGEGLGTI